MHGDEDARQDERRQSGDRDVSLLVAVGARQREQQVGVETRETRPLEVGPRIFDGELVQVEERGQLVQGAFFVEREVDPDRAVPGCAVLGEIRERVLAADPVSVAVEPRGLHAAYRTTALAGGRP
jgi:hypothetical protein